MRAVWWVFAICIWLLSAVASWLLLTTLAMFNELYMTPPFHTLLLLIAPLVALAALAVTAPFRRRARWLPAVLLAVPALQALGLLLAQMNRIP
jgi:hypothetical protein